MEIPTSRAILGQGERFMTRRLVCSILCGGVAVLGAACATKSFVRQQVGATERKLTEQMTTTETTQETKLRETADRVGETRQAIDQADQRLNGLDLRVGEAGARARTAETQARDAEARLSQRLASRNRYRFVEAKSVHFDPDQTEVRSQDVDELASVAKALIADPNAVLELQGFTDARGSDRYNRQLARERVEAVMRYLVQHHGIELRQVRAIAMGKEALAPGEKPGPDALAKARRVDMRLLAPWSSWEDNLSSIQSSSPEQESSTVTSMEPPWPAPIDAPARGGLPEFLKTITPNDLGGK
jgi:outer membrane protein OmpA-like peptidoglycan-associated protein